jgi:outer membrane protein, adhesin transport system
MDNNEYRSFGLFRKLIILSLFVPFAGIAQVVPLPDAVNKAIINYPLIRQRQAEVAAGSAHVRTVAGNQLPSFMLQDQFDAGTTNPLQGAYFSLGIVPSTPGGNPAAAPNYKPNPTNVGISFLQWEFYNFGYYNAQKKEAHAQLAVKEAYLQSDTYLLTESVIGLYIDWLKKYRLLQIQNENVQRMQLILSAIRATVLSGLKPGVDSSTASAAYSDARISYLQALNEYNYDKITLSAYTGMDINGGIPDTSFVAGSVVQNLPQIPVSDSVPASHPLLSVYEKQYEQQLANNNTISKKYLPRLNLNGTAWERSSGISYTGVYPVDITTGLPYSKFNYLAGLSLSYNLFDLKHRHDQLAEGRYEAEARQSMLQTQQVTLNKMMQQANATYATTVEKLREIPVQLYSARQAYGQQMALYRSGLNTLIDVTNAEYALLQAETNYINTQDELLQILYIRAGLSGQLDTFLKNFKR